METFTQPICLQLRQVALALPETSEGSSCVNRAFKVRKKNFLFLGEKPTEVRIMVKLTDSLQAAAELADSRVAVGKHGWVTIRFAPDQPLQAEVLEGWVLESFHALAPKTVLEAMT